ncbi:MAG: NAD(P)H-dependent oxidoreductase subunit E [Lautropia sp.]|nr:NAD(P)H-dependent oxidoreductase subunit E [Lautropia sp.]
MGKAVQIDLSSTGGARGGKLALDIAAASDSPAARTVARIVERFREVPGGLLPMLHAVQDALGYIPAEAVALMAAAMQRSRAEVHGVVSFYPHFRWQPIEGRLLEVCGAEACLARGAQALVRHAEQSLGCTLGETSADGRVTTRVVHCLGLCAQGPAVMLDGQPHAHVHAARLDGLLAAAQEALATASHPPDTVAHDVGRDRVKTSGGSR